MPPPDARYDPAVARRTFGDVPVPPRARVAGAALAAAAALALALAATALTSSPPARAPAPVAVPASAYVPHELIVVHRDRVAPLLAEIRARTGLRLSVSTRPELTPHETLFTLPGDVTPPRAAAVIGPLPGVIRALPDLIAHIAGRQWFPDDPGRTHRIHGWEKLQWNFLAASGVNAPQAWANLLADHRPGARGVVIAVVDTGIAFRHWRTFTRSPDLRATRFRAPCDLVAGRIRRGRCTDPYALDREGHGTFVASSIAESTNNGYGLTGLAYQATLIPVRVLDAQGNGDSSTIAAGIRYAVAHGARVVNLSIEFSPGTTIGQIPDIVSAIANARAHGVVVVGAAGNDETRTLDYPAALPDVISVGATTRDRCLAVYSDIGPQLDLVAPGGGDDVTSVTGSRCHPQRNLPDIYQMTFANSAHPSQFGYPSGWFGTSMAAPDVSAAAAMVIASGVLGRRPTPLQIEDRLEATARPLGSGRPNDAYGYGLLDIGAATRRGGPLVPSPPPYALAGADRITVVR